jgi:predicted DNA-binding protein with PD1-like motif
VLVVFADEIHAAQRVRKTHATSISTFAFPDGGPLGYLVEGTPTFLNRLDHRTVIPDTGGDRTPTVALHTVTLGDDGTLLTGAADRLDGLVIAAFGAGHVPEHLVPVLADLATRIPVVLASRTGSGPTLRSTYALRLPRLRTRPTRTRPHPGWIPRPGQGPPPAARPTRRRRQPGDDHRRVRRGRRPRRPGHLALPTTKQPARRHPQPGPSRTEQRMRSHELILGRTFAVAFDHGEDFFDALAGFCRANTVRQGYIPMFIAGFSDVDIVGTCTKLDDPHAPVWSSVHLTNVEALGAGALAYDQTEDRVLPHIHVTVGLKERSATAHTSHLQRARIQFLTEMILVEVTAPDLRRRPDSALYNVPLLHFPTSNQSH